jgi:branched-subunit amino acid aminotransferase/4-amino-4-deoxychorismate lyase
VRNLELNGRVPDLAETHRLATVNYGHFTSMQVRSHAVRGLALHLARLADGNEEFFGWKMGVDDEARVVSLIRHALGSTADASVRVSFVPGPEADGPPDVVVAVSDARSAEPGRPLRVRTDGYRRDWPEQKHSATMGLVVTRRQAVRDGYDDALFVGDTGLISEGTTWNVAFHDGARVIWPQAPMLKGTTMVLLQIAMTMNGVPWSLRPVAQADLPSLTGAVTVNSTCPAQPIAWLDNQPFPESDRLSALLSDTWKSVPYDEL